MLFSGVALLSNAPERPPERKKKTKEREEVGVGPWAVIDKVITDMVLPNDTQTSYWVSH